MKYRQRPVVIDAVQCKEPNTVADILSFCPTAKPSDGGVSGLVWVEIATLKGTHQAAYGDFIIKDITGEFYPVKPDIFAATYEEVRA